MRFSETHPTVDFDLLRLTSETGVWEFGARRMLFGVRVSANRVGAGMYGMDYCAGNRHTDFQQLFAVCRLILEAQPETLTHAELEALLPGYTVRPVLNDHSCMARLCELAVRARRAS